MKTKSFVSFLVIMIILGAVFVLRSQPFRAKLSFALSLTIPSQQSKTNGTGWIPHESVNFSVLKWPDFSRDDYNLKLTQPFYGINARNSLTRFDVILKLNQIEKIIAINELDSSGSYSGIVNCYFDIKRVTIAYLYGSALTGLLKNVL